MTQLTAEGMTSNGTQVEIPRTPEETEEIKEWHFHVYFFQDNEENRASAVQLRSDIFRLVEEGFFKVVPLWRVHQKPTGPHPIGSFEVWTPKEHLPRALSYFMLHRGPHSVLLHPLTCQEVLDHTDRALWLGKPVPLDLSQLRQGELESIPLQYPELGLGYSAED